MMNDAEITGILKSSKTIAVVGLIEQSCAPELRGFTFSAAARLSHHPC